MRFILLVSFLLLFKPQYSQMNFGDFNTPYSGVHGLKFNPAEIVDSRYKFHFSPVGMGLTFSNNYIAASKDLVSISPATITETNKDTYLFRTLDNKAKHAYAQAHVNLPSFMWAIGKKNKFSFGISSGMNFLITGNNISENLANYIYDNKKTPHWAGSNSKDLGANGSAWAYGGLTLGTVIINSNSITLKAAVTGKVNLGLANIYASSKDIYARFASQNQTAKINGVLEHQVSAPFYSSGTSGGGFKADSIAPFENMGFGGDFGFIFEKKDKKEYNYTFDCVDDNVRRDLNKYSWRFGVSVIDYGYIQWKSKAPIRRTVFDSAMFASITNNSKFGKFPDVDQFTDSLFSLKENGVFIDTSNANYYMWTPTKVNAFIDVHLFKGLYVAANGTYGFVNSNYASSWTQNMQFMFTPRLESRIFGIYLPVSYNMLAQEISAGLGLRLLFLNFAISDWATLAGLKPSTKTFGMNFSLNVPFHQKKQPKDNDHDLMSNKKDKCKDLAGDCNSDGCPLPDDDEDGVPNINDKCPSNKGPKSLDGCPDSDEDGIPDSKDRCPKKKGLKELGGCPDKDGDGIPDHEDKCPSEKGIKDFEGCADTDQDRIPDNLDECPLEKGTFEMKGCPEVIIIDTDGDGILDTADKCPKVIGPVSNQGCPIPSETISVAKMAQEKLEFHTGSAVIKPESIESLTLLSSYLLKNTNLNIELAGHTDNVGREDKNLKLSIDRANAVRDFFVVKGIDASRIKAAGFGMKYPIADNRTLAGRAVNRRVEIDLK